MQVENCYDWEKRMNADSTQRLKELTRDESRGSRARVAREMEPRYLVCYESKNSAGEPAGCEETEFYSLRFLATEEEERECAQAR